MTFSFSPEQVRGRDIARHKKRFAFYWKPGIGKTFLMGGIHLDRPMRTLVAAKRVILTSAWLPTLEQLGIPATLCWGPDKEKRLDLIRTPGEHRVLLTTPEMFKTHSRDFLATGVRRFNFDESSAIKNREAAVTKYAMAFSDRVEECYLLSGTPAPNCDTEFWAQLRTLSPEAAGRDFYSWAYRWFVPRMQMVRGRNVIKGWTHKAGTLEAFHAHLSEWAWALRKEDCLDLPEKEYDVRRVDLSPAERKFYNRIRDELKMEAADGRVESIKSEAALTKLRQAAGGTVLMEGRPEEVGSSRLDALGEFLDEVGPAEPVVIWAEFTAEIDRLRKFVQGRGEAVGVLDGRTKNPQAEIEDFTSGRTTRIVGIPSAVGHGVDSLQRVCSYGAYYSLSFSAEQHEQSMDRIHRRGQKWPCTYVYFVARDTVDENCYRCVRGKMTRQEAVMRELGRSE